MTFELTPEEGGGGSCGKIQRPGKQEKLSLCVQETERGRGRGEEDGS